MSTEIAKATEKSPEVLKKREAYANLGEVIHRAEMDLQVKSQAAILSISKLPTKIEEIADAEVTLKAFKSQRVQIETDRKAVTVKFKPVIDRMMSYEKSLEEPEQKYGAAILSLKKLHEAEEAKKMQVVDARKKLLEFIEKSLADANHVAYEKINTQVAVVFETAIEMDITPAEIQQFILDSEASLTFKDFEVLPPNVSPKILDPDEVKKTIAEKWIYNAQGFVVMYKSALQNKFADYGIAYQNKQVALDQSRKDAEEKTKQLATEKENAEIASTLAAQSTVLEPDSVAIAVKAIKRSYAIDMLETPENAIALMAAFVANKKECLNKLGRVTKWFSVTPAQLGNALASIKNDDNNFQPAGVRFKEVEKL